MPQWEHINAKFDTDYTDLKKSESTNIHLAIQVREYLNNKYYYLRYHPITYYYHLMRLIHYLRRLYINKLKKVNLCYLLVLDI